MRPSADLNPDRRPDPLQPHLGRLERQAYDHDSVCKEVAMQRIGDMFHNRPRDDFGDGDHQEYVENGLRDVLLIGGAAALLIGGFVVSLI